jgi:hypothetical protein
MRDENPPRRCISGERVFFSLLSLGTFETLDHLQTGSCFCPRCTRLKKSKRPLLYCLYRDVWRGIQIIAPPYKDTQKNSPSKLHSAAAASTKCVYICCPWRINQIGEKSLAWIYVAAVLYARCAPRTRWASFINRPTA